MLSKLSPINYRIFLVAIGAIYPLGFAPFGYWITTFLSLSLLINELAQYCSVNSFITANKNSKTKPSNLCKQTKPIKNKPISLFSIGLYWSYGAFGVGVSWVYVSIHEFGHAPILGAIAISFLFVLTLSVVKAGCIHFIGKMVSWFGGKLFLLIVPFVWVISELAQRTLFSGFPWLFAGYSQIDGPMWMLSTWLGVYGVSWFLIAITTSLVLIALTYTNNKKANIRLLIDQSAIVILLLLISIPLLAALTPTKVIKPKKSSIDIALVQPNIAQEKKWNRRYFSQIVDVLYQQSEAHWDADLIVWPEGAIPAYRHQVEDIMKNVDRHAKETNTDLLLGLPVYEIEQDTSFGAFVSVGEHQQTYYKQVLVPFGEYVPLGRWLRGIIEFLNLPMSNFSPATEIQHPMDFSDYQVIPAICYEIAYPDIVHDLIEQADLQSEKPKLIVTVSNDAWFGDSLGPYQHMEMARMRALEVGLPLVRATNDGITAVVDARGNLLEKVERYQPVTLRRRVDLEHYNTLYRKYGLLGVYSLLIITMSIFLVAAFKRKS